MFFEKYCIFMNYINANLFQRKLKDETDFYNK